MYQPTQESGSRAAASSTGARPKTLTVPTGYDSADSDNEADNDDEDLELGNILGDLGDLAIDSPSSSDEEDDLLTEQQRVRLQQQLGERARAASGGGAGGMQGFFRHKKSNRRRWRMNIQKRGRQSVTMLPVNHSFTAPPDCADQLEDIVYQIKICLQTARNCYADSQQPLAYQSMWKIIQYCKELRNLYNRVFIKPGLLRPGFYKVICSMKAALESVLADTDVDVKILAENARKLSGLRDYLDVNIQPISSHMWFDPEMRQRSAQHRQQQEETQDMGLFQSASNRLQNKYGERPENLFF